MAGVLGLIAVARVAQPREDVYVMIVVMAARGEIMVTMKEDVVKELARRHSVPRSLCKRAHDEPAPAVSAHVGSGATCETRRDGKKRRDGVVKSRCMTHAGALGHLSLIRALNSVWAGYLSIGLASLVLVFGSASRGH